jgi:hypothetical protein
VRILNAADEPVSGQLVNFTTTLGYLQLPVVETNNEGYAVTYLHDQGLAGTAYINIHCGNDQSYIDITIMGMNE